MQRILILFSALLILLQGCSSASYIHDMESRQRQEELHKQRSGNIAADIGIALASVILSAAVEADVHIPNEQEFKKLKIDNTTTDTLYINMLTDVYWDEENYCDFMDIRIPPAEAVKVLVPVDAMYNLYFSNTPENDDDEYIEIYTSGIKKISPCPGTNLEPDDSETGSDMKE